MATKKTRDFIRNTVEIVIYSTFFLFLVANILYSQRISELYSNLINNEEVVVTGLLKQRADVSSFHLLYPEIKTIFASYEEEVIVEAKQIQELISKLEILREQNPKSRDILYSLYLLYDASGEEGKAKKYLIQAQQIDPAAR